MEEKEQLHLDNWLPEGVIKEDPVEEGLSRDDLMSGLAKEIGECKGCELWKTRNKPLVGDGSVNAEILFVGESPGYNEDIVGRAFVGEAGKVLDRLLDVVGLKRGGIYITNVLKCHPPKNHNPTRQEIDSCIQYLYKQIGIIKPRIILPMGKFASREVFKKYGLAFTRISKHHGRIFDTKESYGPIRVIPLYHPAVACYHNEMLAILESDFRKLRYAL